VVLFGGNPEGLKKSSDNSSTNDCTAGGTSVFEAILSTT
jgi:hypothetical protein